MTMLKEAIDAGFDKADLLAEDEELSSLRKKPEFVALTKTIAEKAAEAERKRAEAETRTVLSLMKENKPFDFKFSLPNLDDKKVSLDDYKGKVVIVDIWGTWCPPCRREIPHFVDLYKEYHDKGLEIVGINYEQEDTPAEAKKVIQEFLKENKVPYTCVIGDDETQKQVPDFEGYPTTLFLDRAGKVRLKLVGGYEKGALEAAIKKLLDEK
jgi:thiol-disulfide isomerase/thioredoxin